MLKSFVNSDIQAADGLFARDEVQYNLIHRISDGSDALLLRSQDGRMLYAETPGYNGWLWVSGTLSKAERALLLGRLTDRLAGRRLVGLSADPALAAEFAGLYAEAANLQYRAYKRLQAYHCPAVRKQDGVKGGLQRAAAHNAPLIAEFKAGFARDAFGIDVDPSNELNAAEAAIAEGDLYLWVVDGVPVSMAGVAHRSARHARVNNVYTPPAERGKGYAGALVAEVSGLLAAEGLVPMLYADIDNPSANAAYRRIGYVESGLIDDLKFI